MSRLAPETETNAAVHIHNTSDTRWLQGWAGPDSSSTVRPTTPIPNSKSAAAAARGPSVSPPPSDVGGAKQLSQYFWLRRGRGWWRLQIAIFNMLLQPEGGREAGCIFCFRVTVARRPRRRTKPKILRSLLSKANERPAAGWVAGSRSRRGGRLWPHLLLCLSSSSFYFNFLFTQRSGAVGQSKAEAALSLVGRPAVPVVILDT